MSTPFVIHNCCWTWDRLPIFSSPGSFHNCLNRCTMDSTKKSNISFVMPCSSCKGLVGSKFILRSFQRKLSQFCREMLTICTYSSTISVKGMPFVQIVSLVLWVLPWSSEPSPGLPPTYTSQVSTYPLEDSELTKILIPHLVGFFFGMYCKK